MLNENWIKLLIEQINRLSYIFVIIFGKILFSGKLNFIKIK